MTFGFLSDSRNFCKLFWVSCEVLFLHGHAWILWVARSCFTTTMSVLISWTMLFLQQKNAPFKAKWSTRCDHDEHKWLSKFFFSREERKSPSKVSVTMPPHWKRSRSQPGVAVVRFHVPRERSVSVRPMRAPEAQETSCDCFRSGARKDGSPPHPPSLLRPPLQETRLTSSLCFRQLRDESPIWPPSRCVGCSSSDHPKCQEHVILLSSPLPLPPSPFPFSSFFSSWPPKTLQFLGKTQK